ncbi:hypothetical protein LOC68_10800 [Blastopirellula sp. JC732]|uniref:Phosphoribosyltransferase domain-containing protein n=1 Tax=Blastopirellula sediminis TaxID=2894196 RepID=A0A9X1SG04_9BACT|nr:phosphoribosyltransferase family protein [Blastopirellula sediminis]MCC9628888.1 hypothetical protein [Blastopirellula sediminis]
MRRLSLRDPLVLGIPRGGVVTGAELAKTIGADFDVVLAHKLRCPWNPEFAIGAVGEDGQPMVDRAVVRRLNVSDEDLQRECQQQVEEINRRKRLFRGVRPPAEIAGRSVIVTDDGVATGSTMLAALQVVRQRGPAELIVAVPVAPQDCLPAIRGKCDRLVCLQAATEFYAVGEFYRWFEPTTDEEVVEILREFAPAA